MTEVRFQSLNLVFFWVLELPLFLDVKTHQMYKLSHHKFDSSVFFYCLQITYVNQIWLKLNNDGGLFRADLGRTRLNMIIYEQKIASILRIFLYSPISIWGTKTFMVVLNHFFLSCLFKCKFVLLRGSEKQTMKTRDRRTNFYGWLKLFASFSIAWKFLEVHGKKVKETWSNFPRRFDMLLDST